MSQAIIALLSKLVTTISLKRVLTWAAAGFFGIAGFTIYENRAVLFESYVDEDVVNPHGLTFTVGAESQARIMELVKLYDSFAGIAIMSADLRLNEARTLYFHSTDYSLNQAYENSVKKGSDAIPLFTNLEDNNLEMVKAINGEFSCIPFKLSIMGKVYPELAKEIKQVCRSSIPSYYGHFSGYVTVFLRTDEPLTNSLSISKRQNIEKLATDIYFRDVLTSSRRYQPALPIK